MKIKDAYALLCHIIMLNSWWKKKEKEKLKMKLKLL